MHHWARVSVSQQVHIIIFIVLPNLFFYSSLLAQLSPPPISDNIPGWQTQGWVFHQFISVEQAVSTLLQARDEATLQYELEKLKPSVSSLCRAVGHLPVESPTERLAQSEIAKKVKKNLSSLTQH